MMRMALGALVALMLTMGAGAALAQDGETLTGPGEMIDADILAIGNQRVILWGIDAPERAQTCRSTEGRYSCYEAATRELETILSGGDVTCVVQAKRDPFGRRHGECTVGDLSVNAEMVRRGMALPYLDQTDMYVPQEEEAKAAKAGLWQDGVEFDLPWVFRRQQNPSGQR
jgi:endonuclease YncB( thermonuclease family)